MKKTKIRLKGFSLIEAIISVFILSILILFVFQSVMSLSIQSKHNRNMQMLVNEATNAIESELGAKTYNSNTADLSVDRVNKEGYYILKVTAKAKEGDQEIELQRYVKIRGENSN